MSRRNALSTLGPIREQICCEDTPRQRLRLRDVSDAEGSKQDPGPSPRSTDEWRLTGSTTERLTPNKEGWRQRRSTINLAMAFVVKA